MGAAIESFPGAGAAARAADPLRAGQDDRRPAGAALRRLHDLRRDGRRAGARARVDELPYVELDKRYYKLIDEFERRFPAGPPSLRQAERLVVSGDVTFGADMIVLGAVSVSVDHPTTLDAGTTLDGG